MTDLPLFINAPIDPGKAKPLTRPEAYDLAAHEKTVAAMFAGDLTADELRARFEKAAAGEVIRRELEQMTIKELNTRWPYPYSSGVRKDKLVRHCFHQILFDYLLPVGTSVVMTYDDMDFTRACRQKLDPLTDEALAAFAAEQARQWAKKEKALTDPETLEEYLLFIRAHGQDALTHAQLVAFDRLVFERDREMAAREAERTAVVEAVEEIGDDVDVNIKKSWHTKKQVNVWLVQLSERVERDVYKEMAAKARRFGARWSNYGPRENHGFLFWTEADARQFVGLLQGEAADLTERRQRREAEKKGRAADHLATYADNAEGRAMDALTAERLENTYRRAMMAAHIEADARAEQSFAATARSVANALAAGELQALAHVRDATQLAELMSLLQRARYDAIHEEAGGYVEPGARRALQFEDIDRARYPWPTMPTGDVYRLLKALKGKRGAKRTADFFRALLQLAEKKDDGQIRARNPNQAEAFDDALHFLKKPGTYDDLVRVLKDRTAAWKRLQRMGITNDMILRHALRELFPHVVEPGKPDPLKAAIRKLVGLRIPGFFPTPRAVLDIVEPHLNPIADDARVLEPTAGAGHIADWLSEWLPPKSVLECVETSQTLREILTMKGYAVVGDDFYAFEPAAPYDLIVMNPPFEYGQDISMTQRAYKMLAPGGQLLSIMSAGAFFRSDSQAERFREWLEAVGAHQEKLPDGSFGESGTNVATRFIVVTRPW